MKHVTLAASMLVAALVGAFVGSMRIAEARAQDPRKISAETFELLGPDGKSRAMLKTSATGAPELLFASGDGKKNLLQLGQIGGGPGLLLFDREGRPRASFSINNDIVRLDTVDADGKRRFRLETAGDGKTTMQILEGDKAAWTAP